MDIMSLLDELNDFKNESTNQSFLINFCPDYKHDQVKLLCVKTSNKTGGITLKQGKQWGLILDTNYKIEEMPNYIALKKILGDDIKVKNGRKEYSDNLVIRFYSMSLNPNEHIIISILNYIFSNV